ncbi:MAG: MarR family transcriptional regulator [Chitinophagaceae bacterium]
MAETVKSMGRSIARAFASEGIDIPMEQFMVLNIINASEEIIQHDIVIAMNKDKSGVLRIIQGLEQKRLIVRVPDDTDRRRKILVVTKKGVETINRALEIEAAVIEQLLEGVPEKELKVLSRVLDTIRRNIKD